MAAMSVDPVCRFPEETGLCAIARNGSSVEDFKVIAQGFKSFLYLCKPGDPEYLGEQAEAACKEIGVQYTQCSVTSASFSVELWDSVYPVIKDMPQPCVIGCKTGTRASAVALLNIAAQKNMTPAEAWYFGLSQKLPFYATAAVKKWVASCLNAMYKPNPLVFRQIFEAETCTYTYVLMDEVTKEAVIIDPVKEKVERDLKVLQELGAKLLYALETHVHADHCTSGGLLRERTQCQLGVAAVSGADCDFAFQHGDVIKFGSRYVMVRSTPGHTDGCSSFVLDDLSHVFTGDALFVRGCGRTDFQQGSADHLYDSIHGQIFVLPGSCIVFPGHDYQGLTSSTVGEEIEFNPRLGGGKTKQEFVDVMQSLHLANPKKIHIAVPGNMHNGLSC